MPRPSARSPESRRAMSRSRFTASKRGWPNSSTHEAKIPDEEMQTLGQQQPVTPTPIDLEQLRRRSTRLSSCVQARNVRETIAGLIAIALLVWTTIGDRDPMRLASSLLLILGMSYVVFHLW